MWQWLEEFLGGDGITMRTVILAGGRHSRKMAEALLDHEKLLSAGFPVRPDLLAVFNEDPRTKEGCEYWNAHERFYYSCASRKPAIREPGELGGRWIEEYVTSAQRWKVRKDLTSFGLFHGDPCDESFRERVDLETRLRASRPLAAKDRLFHACLCLPWGRWIGPWIREKCGEVVRMVGETPEIINGKRQLLRIGDSKWSHGFVFGLHPLYDCGGAVAAEALSGADPLERILQSYLEMYSLGFPVKNVRARMGVYGIGPWKMDDGRLFAHAGPSRKLSKWRFQGWSKPLTMADIGEEEWHTAVREMVEGTKELIPNTLVVNRGRDGYGLADALAAQIWVLYHANNPTT